MIALVKLFNHLKEYASLGIDILSLFNRIFSGQNIDQWASDHTLMAARTLNQVAADIIASVEEEVAQAGIKQGLIAPSTFVNDRVAPIVRAVAEPVARRIIDEANRALEVLVSDQAIWLSGPEHSQEPESAFDGATDVVVAMVPLAAGLATAAAIPFVAVTTTTAWFGLVTMTAVSWPVVAGAGSLTALLLATGVLNTAKIRDRTKVRLRIQVRRFVIASLVEGTAQTPSILQQIALEFQRTAKRAKAI